MSALDEYTRSLMNPDELEAIEDPDYDTGEDDADADGADEKGGKDDAAADAGDQNALPVEGADPKPADAASAAAPAPAPAAEPATEQAAAPAAAVADPAPAPQFVPRYEAALPADHQAKLDDIAAKEADLKAKFKAGEIDFDAYETERETLIRDRAVLDRATVKAEISQEMTQQTAQQQWQNTINSFMSQVQGELDYRRDPEKCADLDQFVKVLANNTAYASKPAEWFLQEAHRRVQALYGLTPAAAPAAAAPAPKPTLAEVKAARKPAVAAAPASLAQVPGGDGPGDVADEFVDIDSLTGFAQEDAIRRMSPEQRERYLKGA
ncbi:hypothetical protein [Roseateles sp.]|uniref:hypothetical protein n=1 Tax=Roseateles sp. TaxID=1971397 RepID=UPI002E002E7F|nr:hypothetical protein [Roseateles sp.]